MSVTVKPLAELTHEAIDLFCRELGSANTLRSLSQFNSGAGDYPEQRDALVGGMTLPEIFAGARRIQNSEKPG